MPEPSRKQKPRASRKARAAPALSTGGGAESAAGIAVTAKDPKVFSLLVADFSIEPYAFALPRGDSALRLVINRELTRVYVSGEIEEIFARWLGKLGRPSGMLAAMYVLNAVPD